MSLLARLILLSTRELSKSSARTAKKDLQAGDSRTSTSDESFERCDPRACRSSPEFVGELLNVSSLRGEEDGEETGERRGLRVRLRVAKTLDRFLAVVAGEGGRRRGGNG